MDVLLPTMLEADLIPYEACGSLGRGPALVLAPHPDDEVFGCAGALVDHAAAGDPLKVVIVTDGAWMEDEPYAATRRDECRAAGRALGYTDIEFWALPDRSLVYGEDLVARIQAVIERQKAVLVYAPSTREIHPDHRALALSAAEAVRRTVRPIALVMYEVGVPLAPNRLLDITALRDRKQAAMDCFTSQIARQSYDQHIAALNRFRTYTLPPTVVAAEAYRLVSGDDLRADPVGALRQDQHRAPGWTAEASLDLPLVSVLVRDRGRPGLRATLDAVAHQTYPHLEILVVATERTIPEQAAWWGRFPLQSIIAPATATLAEAANLGLNHCAGRYLIVLDDDTQLPPERIAAMVEPMRQTGALWCMRPMASGRSAHEAWSADPLDLLAGDSSPLHEALFDRQLIERGCRFDETLPPELADRDFLLQAAGGDQPAAPGSAPRQAGTAESERTLEPLCEKWRQRWTGQDLASALRRSQIRAVARQHQIDDLTGQQNELAGRYHQAQREIEELHRENATLRQALAESEHLAEACHTLEAAAKQIEADNHSLTLWANGLRQSLTEIQGSTSWRATGPLRQLGRWIRAAERALRHRAAER